MIRHAVCLSLVCGAIAPAQQPSIEVQDLLAGEAHQSRAQRAWLVRRVTLAPTGTEFARLVSGEGHLLGQGDDYEPFLAPRPLFAPDALLALLRVLRPGVDRGLDLLQFGERIELRSQAPELLQAALADVRAALPPRVRLVLRLERQLDDRTTVLLQGEQEFVNGETLILGDVEQTTQVLDVDVEIAQAAMVGNPVEVDVTHGTSAVVRARTMPWTAHAVVECVVRHAAPFDHGVMPRTSTIGRFDRHATRVDEAGLVFRVGNGEPARHEWQASDGSTLRLICDVRWQPPQERTTMLISPLLNDPVVGFRSSRRGEPEEPTEILPIAAMVRSRIEAHDDGNAGSVRWIDGADGGGALRFEDADRLAEAQRIFAVVDEAMRPVSTTLEVLSVPLGAEVATDGELPAGAERLWRASGPAVLGLPSCFSGGRQRSYVHDWDVEVAQASRIADPKVAICEDGWFATVKPLPAITKGQRRVELALQHVDFVSMQQLELVVGEQVNASTDAQEVVLPREELTIEKPVTRSIAFATTATLNEQGGVVLRRAAARTLGEGREMVVRLFVR